MMDRGISKLSPLQYACIATLTAYTSGLSFLMHASRKGPDGLYFASTSVFLGESLKLVISLYMEHRRIGYEDSMIEAESEERLLDSPTIDEKDQEMQKSIHIGTWPKIRSEIFANDCWKMSIPAALYVCQNILQLFAITTITPGLYQAVT